jgi:hypothetical protein
LIPLKRTRQRAQDVTKAAADSIEESVDRAANLKTRQRAINSPKRTSASTSLSAAEATCRV